MMTTDNAFTSSFNRFRPLIQRIVNRFVQRYGGDYQELEAEAYYLFCRAYRSWKPGKGPLNKRVTWLVKRGLIDYLRDNINQKGKHDKFLPPSVNHLCGYRFRPEFSTRLAELSDDARTTVDIALRNRNTTIGRRGTGQLAVAVRQETGWGPVRIGKAFQEIREIL